MASLPTVQFNRPNPEQAEGLSESAVARFKNRQFEEAIGLLERAIRIDQIGALNGYLDLRAECAQKIDRPELHEALEWYDYAATVDDQGRSQDAQVAYQEAMALDPLFLWPGNNLAWRLSTSTDKSLRDGRRAISYAEDVCQRSSWSCWAFLGTLAAAYAEAGDFDQAIQWQQASHELTPADSQRDSVIVLRHFESKRPYTDFGMPVAAGRPRREKPSEALDPKEFLFSDRISMRVVCELLRSTYFDIEEDDGERLWIDDRIRVSVRLSDDRDQLAFLTIASANENADTEATLRFVNRVNSEFSDDSCLPLPIGSDKLVELHLWICRHATRLR